MLVVQGLDYQSFLCNFHIISIYNWCSIKFLKELGSLFDKFCLVEWTLSIGLLRGRTLLVGPFCYLLMRKTLIISFGTNSVYRLCGALFWRSLVLAMLAKGAFARQLRSSFFIHLSERNANFLWLVGMCAMIWDIWKERIDRVFRGRERAIAKFGPLLDFMCLFGLRFQRP